MKLAVLNPGGRDPDQHFPDGAGEPSERAHAPVNFHGFAACVNGSFYRNDEAIPRDTQGVLLLLRNDLKASKQSIIELRRAKIPFVISLKETGTSQVVQTLRTPGRLELCRYFCERADGAIAVTEELAPLFRSLGARPVEFIPTPYPVDDERWNFGLPYDLRDGVMLGTREFDIASRQHLAALLVIKPLAEAMGQPVTVVNTEGWRGRRILAGLNYAEGMLRVVEGRMPYPKYLQLLAKHRLVFQLDASAVPGQVAGDCLLARVPCVGGNGAVERLAWSELSGHGRSAEQLFDLAARLLEHPHECEAVVERAREAARLTLSYPVVARQFRALFERFHR